MRTYVDTYMDTTFYRRLIKAGKHTEAVFLIELLKEASIFGLIDVSSDSKKEAFLSKMNDLGFIDQQIDDCLVFLESGKLTNRGALPYIERTEKFILVKHKLLVAHDYNKKGFETLNMKDKFGMLLTSAIYLENLEELVLTLNTTSYPLSEWLLDWGAPITVGNRKGIEKANKKQREYTEKRLGHFIKPQIQEPAPQTEPTQERTDKNTNKILGLLKAKKDNPIRNELMQALNSKYKERTPQVIEAMCEYSNFEKIKISCDKQSYPDKRKDAILKHAQAINMTLNGEYSDPNELMERMERKITMERNDWIQDEQ